jgi:hypothetical protein
MNVLSYNTKNRKVIGTLYRHMHKKLNKENEKKKKKSE